VGGVPQQINGMNRVSLPLSGGDRFYELLVPVPQ
jgi:hypothetical protein